MQLLWAGLLIVSQALQVGSAGRFPSIGAALAAAGPGDTVRVAAGVYHEKLVIDVPVVLIGEPGAVIDGDGEGTVIRVDARAVIAGFRVTGSGRLLEQEDTGIMVTGDSCVIRDNVLDDVLFGIYLKDSQGTRVAGNRITGKDRPMGRRGDGIRLWSSNDAVVEGNVVQDTRDVVVYFSHGLLFRGNLVTRGRYGLNYMYSSDNTFENNEFTYNDVAAFIMYSEHIVLRNNVFAQAADRFI